jgi:hypothetical protein
VRLGSGLGVTVHSLGFPAFVDLVCSFLLYRAACLLVCLLHSPRTNSF